VEVFSLSVKLKEEGAAAVKSAIDKLRGSTEEATQELNDAARAMGLWRDQAGKLRQANGQFATDAQRIAAGLNASSGAGNRFQQILGDMQKSSLLTAGALALVAQRLINTADTAQLLNARLRLVTDSQENLIGVENALRASADATRSSYEATVELYTRVARNTKNLSISQSELLRFTELTQMAIKTSGATSQEASAALVQLSQGLAAGALRGDEFRSVMEQTPGLARAIADGLGVSIGQLRAMAMQGELTAEQVVGAVLRMDATIRKDFSAIPMTVSDAFTVMRNNILFAVRDVNTALGGAGTTGLAGALQMIAKDVVPALAEGLVAFFKGFELLAVDAAIAVQKILGLIKREAVQAGAFLKDMLSAGLVDSGPAIKAAEDEYAALVAGLEAYRAEQYAGILAGAMRTDGVIRETSATRQLAGAVRELNREFSLAATEQLAGGSLFQRARQAFATEAAKEAKKAQEEMNRVLVSGATFNQTATAPTDLFKNLRNPIREQAAQMANEIQGTVADSIASGIEDGLVSGIMTAVSTGRIADAWRSMSQAIIQNMASAMVKVALTAIRFGELMKRIRDFMILNPTLAVASAIAMLAFAYANGGKSQSVGTGVSGGAGGAQYSPIASTGVGQGSTNQIIFGATSATTAAGMTPRSATNVTIIGPDDPKAQRAIQELISKGNTRGTLG
jgi:tape measure domain-containing protein